MRTVIFEMGPDAVADFNRRRHGIVVAKRGRDGAPVVVWAYWAPSRLDALSWRDVCGIYAGHMSDREPLRIAVKASVYPARDRSSYVFGCDGFAPPAPDGRIPAGHYDVTNGSPFTAVFGLVQTAIVNGRRLTGVVNAAMLAPTVAADFALRPELHVWTAADAVPGTILAVPDQSVTIRFGPGGMLRRCRYDAAQSRFLPLLHDITDVPRFGGFHHDDFTLS
jgi:hypothetical protein